MVSATLKDMECTFLKDGDMFGNDLASVPSKFIRACCPICRKYPGCRAFTWTDHNGGTCWLKTKRGDTVSKPDAVSGYF